MSQKCDYWDLGHLSMNCKNCMVLNKEYCREKFGKESIPNKCEFFDLCKHKFIRPFSIINLKEEDLDIKSWCIDLKELKYLSNKDRYGNIPTKSAKCVIRDEVLSVFSKIRGVY